MLELSVLTGPDAGKTATFDDLPVTIGRSVEADFRLSDPLAAALHGRFYQSDAGAGYEDLGSRLGTMLEDERGSVALQLGAGATQHAFEESARLVVGESLLQVRYDGELGLDEALRTLPRGGAHTDEVTARLGARDPRVLALHGLMHALWTAATDWDVVHELLDAMPRAFEGAHMLAIVLQDLSPELPSAVGAGGMRVAPVGPLREIALHAAAAGAMFERTVWLDGAARWVCARPIATTGATLGALVLVPGEAGPRDLERELLETFAANAAIVLERLRLQRDLLRMFEAAVAVCVAAVDARDPSTAGHSIRVAELSVRLWDAAVESGMAPGTDASQRESLRYAAILHDLGKIGVSERVLMKAKRLDEAREETVRVRIEAARCAAQAGRPVAGPLTERGSALQALDALEDVVDAAQRGERSDWALLTAAAASTFVDSRGRPVALLTESELECLTIPRGTLTEVERAEMRGHVEHTERLLAQIPWPSSLRSVPAIAALHHEKLDGSGYPRGVSEAGIPLEARVLTIADIFDAMTGAERSYQAPCGAGEALAAMAREAADGALDGRLVALLGALVQRASGTTGPQQTPA